ncbi:MAG: hypothetical protein INH37_11580, partial [Myxococcaceae bacterium]|nr:hypothetical protein [Myxococcaceae bacterium]
MPLLLATGCLEPTALRIDVTTDVPCAQSAGVTITLGAPGAIEQELPSTVTRDCRDGTIGWLSVVPQDDRQASVAVRVAMSLGGNVEEDCTPERRFRGCIVSRRLARFLPQRTVRVPVALYANCRDVPCDPDTTCSQSGQCISARLPSPSCNDAECLALLPGEGADGGVDGGPGGGSSGGGAGGSGGGSAGGSSGGSAGGSSGGSAG